MDEIPSLDPLANPNPEPAPPSIRERTEQAMEKSGEDKLAKILTIVKKIAGAEQIFKTGGRLVLDEKIKPKFEDIKTQAIDLKDRTRTRLTEAEDRATERYTSTKDSLANKITQTKEKASNKARELKDRAIKAGLNKGLEIEDRIVAIFTDLSTRGLYKKAYEYRAQAKDLETSLSQKIETFAQEQNDLTQAQQKAIETFMQGLLEEAQNLKQSQEEEKTNTQETIQASRKAADELFKKAAKRRDTINKNTIFLDLVRKSSQ